MPIFEYKCRECKTDFEELVRQNSAESMVACPNCESKNVEKKFSLFGFSSNSGTKSAGSVSSSCSGCASGNCATCH